MPESSTRCRSPSRGPPRLRRDWSSQVKFENAFLISASPQEAWKAVLDVPSLAPCFPGAALTEQVDADTFKGTVSVKLGPLALSFKGTAQIVEKDESKRTFVVRASGADTKGRGQAKATAEFKLLPDPRGTRVAVLTDLALTGSVAQFGRGATVIQEVSAGLIEQFEKNLNARFSTAGVATPDATPAPAAQGGAAAPDNSIGIGLIWRILKRLVRRAFGRGTPAIPE